MRQYRLSVSKVIADAILLTAGIKSSAVLPKPLPTPGNTFNNHLSTADTISLQWAWDQCLDSALPTMKQAYMKCYFADMLWIPASQNRFHWKTFIQNTNIADSRHSSWNFCTCNRQMWKGRWSLQATTKLKKHHMRNFSFFNTTERLLWNSMANLWGAQRSSCAQILNVHSNFLVKVEWMSLFPSGKGKHHTDNFFIYKAWPIASDA